MPSPCLFIMNAHSWQVFAPCSLWVAWRPGHPGLVPPPVLNDHLGSPTCALKPVRHLTPVVGDSVWTQKVRDCSASASWCVFGGLGEHSSVCLLHGCVDWRGCSFSSCSFLPLPAFSFPLPCCRPAGTSTLLLDGIRLWKTFLVLPGPDSCGNT